MSSSLRSPFFPPLSPVNENDRESNTYLFSIFSEVDDISILCGLLCVREREGERGRGGRERREMRERERESKERGKPRERRAKAVILSPHTLKHTTFNLE